MLHTPIPFVSTLYTEALQKQTGSDKGIANISTTVHAYKRKKVEYVCRNALVSLNKSMIWDLTS